MREIKVGFARFYNRRHHRRQGYFGGDRFKSLIVENGETLINCLAYIDLNPLRAGLIERPEQYRWNSLGYHAQTDNQDDFPSTDFGLNYQRFKHLFHSKHEKKPNPIKGLEGMYSLKRLSEMVREQLQLGQHYTK
jgi:hypothetical protein